MWSGRLSPPLSSSSEAVAVVAEAVADSFGAVMLPTKTQSSASAMKAAADTISMSFNIGLEMVILGWIRGRGGEEEVAAVKVVEDERRRLLSEAVESGRLMVPERQSMVGLRAANQSKPSAIEADASRLVTRKRKWSEAISGREKSISA